MGCPFFVVLLFFSLLCKQHLTLVVFPFVSRRAGACLGANLAALFSCLPPPEQEGTMGQVLCVYFVIILCVVSCMSSFGVSLHACVCVFPRKSEQREK